MAKKPAKPSLADELKTLRDDARVRLHLAGNEVRDAWHALSKQAERVAIKLEQVAREAEKAPATEKARLKLHLAAMDLQQRWQVVQPQLHAVSVALSKKGAEAMAALADLPSNQQKLQARLAEMDAADAVAARLEQGKQEFQKAKNAGQKAVREATKTFRDALKSIKKSLA